MKTIPAFKSLLVCSILFSVCTKGMAKKIDAHYANFFIMGNGILIDTSGMYYYSFQSQKTIKYRELIKDSGMSYIQTCVGRELVLTAPNYGETAKYSWEGPNGFKSQLSELKFSQVQLENDGIYVVNVSKDDLTVLGKIKLMVKPMPEAEISNNVFLEDEAIRLEANNNMPDVKYEWRNMDRKVISKSKDLWISPKKMGRYNYFLTAKKEGCEVSKNIEITVGSDEVKPLYNNTVDVLRHSFK